MSKYQGRTLPFSISQNFLTGSSVIHRLLRKTDITKSDTVLEIGAGKGHITAALLEKSSRVIAVEIDPKLTEYLKKKFEKAENLTLVQGDFLKTPLPNTPYKVFANIPFSHTTEIVRKLTSTQNPPVEAWLTMEKGAAKRFCGKPGESLNSLLLKPFFDLEVVWHFCREDFHPAPRVDTVLLHIAKKPVPDLPLSVRPQYTEFLTRSIQCGIIKPQGIFTQKQIKTALKLAGLPPIEPSGDILYIQWLCLFRSYMDFIYKKE